jgi:hypothetical protein
MFSGNCGRTEHSQTDFAAAVVTRHTPLDKIEHLCYTLGHDALQHFLKPVCAQRHGHRNRLPCPPQPAMRNPSTPLFAKRTHFSQLCIVPMHPSAKRPAAVGRGCEASRRSWAGLRSVLSAAKGRNPGRPGPCQLTCYRTLQQPWSRTARMPGRLAVKTRLHRAKPSKRGLFALALGLTERRMDNPSEKCTSVWGNPSRKRRLRMTSQPVMLNEGKHLCLPQARP